MSKLSSQSKHVTKEEETNVKMWGTTIAKGLHGGGKLSYEQ